VKDLLSIGQFAALCRLSQKALRLYDERGLLRPAHVDPDTGYRRYGLSQAVEAERIRLLRALEVPLDEIGELLRAGGESARALLLRHRSRLAARAAEYDRMLAALDGLSAATLGSYAILERQLLPLQVLSVRWTGPYVALGPAASAAFAELVQHLRRSGASLAGPPLAIFDLEAGFREEAIAVEWSLPVDRPLSGVGRVSGRELAGGPAACTLNAGPFDTVGPAYAALHAWLSEQGRERDGPVREAYLVGPRQTDDPREFRTEVQLPVR
jgi:DNA-binding transcriptional MerR regulator